MVLGADGFFYSWIVSNECHTSFLMAPSLVLALGVACLGRRILLLFGFVVCIVEALLISPAHWYQSPPNDR